MTTGQLQGTSLAIHKELRRRGIAVTGYRAGRTSCIVFEYAGQTRFITGSAPDIASGTSRVIVDNKELVGRLLSQSGEFDEWLIPSLVVHDRGAAEGFLREYGVAVVKPIDAAHGDGVTTGVCDAAGLERAIDWAQQHTKGGGVLMQRHVEGGDYRFIVIDGEVVAAIQRCPAEVEGDGVHTIEELIIRDNENNPRRGRRPYEKAMDPIKMEAVRAFLSDDELYRIPADGERVQVTGVANISSGGYAIECLNEVPDKVKQMAVRVAAYFGLFICGVDVMASDDFREVKLIELNASPALMPYYNPLIGTPANVPSIYIDKLLAAYDRTSSFD
ncbi:MAG: hypothetical protein Q4F02_00040 [Candidatus Saccharibacteria bacterium]|nr:hypothetical protein [Candidatus Saccharibacteria bacterium]